MTMKRIFQAGLGITVFLTVVLGVHIYLVTRPGKVDAHTVAMARIDFKQDITQADANKITKWLSAQQGVVHTLCNPDSDISVFSYRPVQSNADQLVRALVGELKYDAVRHVPDAAALQSGCPMKSGSSLSRLISIFNF
jgi:hypothetical protein